MTTDRNAIDSLELNVDYTGWLQFTDGVQVGFRWTVREGGKEIRGTDPPEFELFERDSMQPLHSQDYGIDEDELQERLQDSYYGIRKDLGGPS